MLCWQAARSPVTLPCSDDSRQAFPPHCLGPANSRQVFPQNHPWLRMQASTPVFRALYNPICCQCTDCAEGTIWKQWFARVMASLVWQSIAFDILTLHIYCCNARHWFEFLYGSHWLLSSDTEALKKKKTRLCCDFVILSTVTSKSRLEISINSSKWLFWQKCTAGCGRQHKPRHCMWLL